MSEPEPTPTPPPVHRRFTLLDIMILVAACAVGLGVVAAEGRAVRGMSGVLSGVVGALAGLHVIGPLVIWH